VHISELSWSHVNHPSEVVKVGDPVNVQVLDVDLTRERISLGLKQTTEDPWKMLVKNFPVGSIIEGSVTKLVPFGAFVELGDGVEGLVHISEMAKGHVETPDQVTSVGTKVHVKVMDVDLERRRISLSMRAAAETLGFTIEIAGGTEEAEEGTDEAVESTEAVEAVEGEVAEVAEAPEAEAAPEEAAPEAVEAEVVAEETPEAEVVAEVAPEAVAEEVAPEAVEAEVVVEETAEVVADEVAEDSTKAAE